MQLQTIQSPKMGHRSFKYFFFSVHILLNVYKNKNEEDSLEPMRGFLYRGEGIETSRRHESLVFTSG